MVCDFIPEIDAQSTSSDHHFDSKILQVLKWSSSLSIISTELDHMTVDMLHWQGQLGREFVSILS